MTGSIVGEEQNKYLENLTVGAVFNQKQDGQLTLKMSFAGAETSTGLQ